MGVHPARQAGGDATPALVMCLLGILALMVVSVWRSSPDRGAGDPETTQAHGTSSTGAHYGQAGRGLTTASQVTRVHCLGLLLRLVVGVVSLVLVMETSVVIQFSLPVQLQVQRIW